MPPGPQAAALDLKGALDWVVTSSSVLSAYPGVSTAVALLVVGGILLTGVAVYVMAAVWIERKVCAHMQDRLGPMRVGWHGILQSIVDPVKLGLKEDLVPEAADRPLFLLAPFVILCSAFATFVVIPFTSRFVMGDLNIGVLYVVSVGSGVLMGTVMAGWSSNNKWALFGAMRTVAMVVSYEIPIGLSIIPVVMVTGSLNMQDIIRMQAPYLAADGSIIPGARNLGFMYWNVFQYFPFMAIGFLIFYVASLAETNRTPFDLAEAESELVAGYHTEYSGIRWSFFFLAEYADMLVLSLLGSVLFLGGWLPLQIGNVRTPDFWVFWASALCVMRYLWYLWTEWYIPKFKEYLLVAAQAALVVLFFVLHLLAPQFLWIMTKSLVMVFVMIWLRWTLPRLRIDQLMHVCWKVLLPIAFANFVAIGIWYVRLRQ